jgi:hypothetical protein
MTTKHMVKKFTYRRHFEIFPGTLYHLIRLFLSLALRQSRLFEGGGGGGGAGGGGGRPPVIARMLLAMLSMAISVKEELKRLLLERSQI